jgi:predicted acyl esterase
VLPGLVVERDVPARVRDDTVFYADVYRPSSGGPFPVILMRLPYDKTQAQSLTYRHPARYAARGYMVVVQDTRGRWRSEGEFYPFAHEAEDGYDTAAWAASLPRSNGRVGMYGFSYVGGHPAAGRARPSPGLRTICPALAGSQYYEGWAHNGGAFALAFNASWATMLTMDDARRAGDGPATRSLNAAFPEPGFLRLVRPPTPDAKAVCLHHIYAFRSGIIVIRLAALRGVLPGAAWTLPTGRGGKRLDREQSPFGAGSGGDLEPVVRGGQQDVDRSAVGRS